MKKLISMLIVLAMLFSLAACGSSSGSGGERSESGKVKYQSAPDGPGGVLEPERFDFSGCWVCDGLRSGETEMSASDLKSMLGINPDEIFCVEIFDGYAIAYFMGEGLRLNCERSEDEDAVILSLDPAAFGEDAGLGDLTLRLESDGRLSFEEELGTLLLKGVDRRPDALAGQLNLYFCPDYTDDQTLSLAHFIAYGEYIKIGDTFYGKLAQDSTRRMTLCSFTLSMDSNNVWPEISNVSVLVEDCVAMFLTEVNGMLYFVNYDMANNEDYSICRINPDGSGFEVLIEDASDFMQIVGDRIYYCNDDYSYCSAKLDGSDAKVVINHEMYYPYQVQPGLLFFQDDADHESLHMMDLETGADMRVATGRIYDYGILGNYLYFTRVDEETDIQTDGCVCRMYRMDLTMPYPEYTEDGEILFAYRYEVSDLNIGDSLTVYPDMIHTNNYGMAEPEKWNTIADDSYYSLNDRTLYRDEDWYIIENKSSAGYITGIDFYSVHNAHGSTYLYVEDIK